MSFTVTDFHDLVRLVEERPEWRAELRRLVLTEELLALPEQLALLRQETERGFQRVDTQLAQLFQAQMRTEEQLAKFIQSTDERFAQLFQAQARTEEQVAKLFQSQSRMEEELVKLSQAQARTEEELRWLVGWQRGESGRRDGERYERDTIRRAVALFNGGQGGSPEKLDVQQRLATQLGTLLSESVFDVENDPFLADIVWWKNGRMAVIEVSLQVDRQDVARVVRRAATLKRSNAEVTAIVIGEQWATDEAREQAQLRQVDWKVGNELSDGFLAFRH